MALTSLGGAIYEDGDPVSIQLAGDESTTVPTGETWVVTLLADGSPGQINNKSIGKGTTYDTVLTGGTTLSAGSSLASLHIGGWRL